MYQKQRKMPFSLHTPLSLGNSHLRAGCLLLHVRPTSCQTHENGANPGIPAPKLDISRRCVAFLHHLVKSRLVQDDKGIHPHKRPKTNMATLERLWADHRRHVDNSPNHKPYPSPTCGELKPMSVAGGRGTDPDGLFLFYASIAHSFLTPYSM